MKLMKENYMNKLYISRQNILKIIRTMHITYKSNVVLPTDDYFYLTPPVTGTYYTYKVFDHAEKELFYLRVDRDELVNLAFTAETWPSDQACELF